MSDMMLSEFAEWLSHTADYIGHYDASNALTNLRGQLAESVRENFDGAHAPSSEPWASLKNPDHPPLVRTGDLKISSIAAALSGPVIDDSLSFDLYLLPDYWLYQQEGTRTIPARPFIGFPDEFPDSVLGEIVDDMVRQLQPR